MKETCRLTPSMRRRQIQSYIRVHRAATSFNTNPVYRDNAINKHIMQTTHGFGITRYNKKKHK